MLYLRLLTDTMVKVTLDKVTYDKVKQCFKVRRYVSKALHSITFNNKSLVVAISIYKKITLGITEKIMLFLA